MTSSTTSTPLEKQFTNFSKFGTDNKTADGKTITLIQVDKWLMQAGLLDGKQITNTDTGICFNKFKTRTIDFTAFRKFLNDLVHRKRLEMEKVEELLTNCGLPGTTKAPGAGVPLKNHKRDFYKTTTFTGYSYLNGFAVRTLLQNIKINK